MIRSYLGVITNDYKAQGEQRIKLLMKINFMSSKDSDEIGSMHTTGNNIEIIKVMKPMSSLKKN